MIMTAITRAYFHAGLNHANLWFKIIKTACLLSFPLIEAFYFTLNDFCLLFFLMLPCVYGIAFYAKKLSDDRMYERLSQGGAQAFKNAGDLENAIYLIFEYLESTDPIVHAKF
jgi:hypothetical protein